MRLPNARAAALLLLHFGVLDYLAVGFRGRRFPGRMTRLQAGQFTSRIVQEKVSTNLSLS